MGADVGSVSRMANGMTTYVVNGSDGTSREVTQAEFEAMSFNPPPITESPNRLTVHPFEAGIIEGRRAMLEESQSFFAELAASLTPPHIDDRYKKSIQELLLRAQGRGLYTP